MSQTPDSEQSSSVQQVTASYPFVGGPLSPDGGATVINPERRGLGGSSLVFPPAPTGSGLWNRLFPAQSAVETDGQLPSPAGCRLEHFVIQEAIGTGGMGAVFRAIDERLQRVVALKVLSPGLSRDVAAVQRFQNEARAAARLDHDNIARVFYVGEEQGLHFIAHEFVTGQNVRDMIRERGSLDPAEAVNFTLQIATALNHTSAAGVVHRDIKPSNIIITPKGRAKLVDLGLAKKQQTESVGELTVAGTTLGTFDYISPEQAKDPRNVDVRSDIYSLGCTLYHMLTGEPPYPEGTVLQKLLDHHGKGTPNPSEKNPRVSDRLSEITRKMMASDPRDRYSDPDELIRDLLPVAASYGLRGTNPEGLVWTAPKPSRERFWERNLGVVVTASILLLIVAIISQFPPGTGRQNTQVAAGKSATNDTPPATNNGSADSTGREAANTKSSDAKNSGALDASGVASPDGTNVAVKAFDEIPSVVPPASQHPLSVNTGSPGKTASGTAPGSGGSAAVAANRRKPIEAERPKVSRNDTRVVGSNTTQNPEVVAAPPPLISIVTEEGVPKAYATLESAAADAKDGAIIELRYNGWRGSYDKPLRITGKKITMRAARGFRPLVRFAPREIPPFDYDTRMMTVSNGSLDLVNLDFEVVVQDLINTDRWACLSLIDAARVRLEGVHIAVPNQGGRAAAVVEIISGTNRAANKMNMVKKGAAGVQPLFEFRTVESFVAGGCDLIISRDNSPCSVDIQRSALALTGSLISEFGGEDAPLEDAELMLNLEHVTCLLGTGLLRMDSDKLPRFLLPVNVVARNNIFAAGAPQPLISMTGNTSPEDFRHLLRWEGDHNFYDRYETFWLIASQQVMGAESALRFEDWKRAINDADSGANNGGIVWRRPWSETLRSNAAEISVGDLSLARGSLAVSGATDGSDVGADLTRLPRNAQPR